MSASEKTTLPLLLPPQDILVEILSKLPAKSLVRFKCVSKFFCALMADHSFGVLHRSRSLTLPSRAGVLISIESPTLHAAHPRAYYTVNFSEENHRGMLQANRVRYFDGESIQIDHLCSSSDGLICLYRTKGDVLVCNVSTGQHISLPAVPGIQSECCSMLLGFDSESKRYKVLMSDPTFDRGCTYKHWVLTVGVDKSWREINNCSSHIFYPFHCYDRSYYSHTNVYIDGVIYSYNWLTSKDDELLISFDIVAFQVGSESFSLIPFPREVVQSLKYFLGKIYRYSEFVHKNFALLEVDEGRLAIVVRLSYGCLDLGEICVWTWEKSKGCWEMITMTLPWEECGTINGVRFTTNHAGEIVLLCINSQQFFILVCNLKSKVWRKYDVGGIEEFPNSTPGDVRMCRIMDNVFSLK